MRFQPHRGIADLQEGVIGSVVVLVHFLPIFSRFYLGLRTSESQVVRPDEDGLHQPWGTLR